MTLCFKQETDVIVKTPYIQEIDIVNMVEDEDRKDIKRERERLQNCPQKYL